MPIHGYPGNVITANPVAPTSTVATGVWTTEQQLKAVAAGNWPFTIPTQQISRSLRFNSADSTYLNKTFSTTPTNRAKKTVSCWYKRSNLSSTQNLFSSYNGGGQDGLYITSGDSLSIYAMNGGASGTVNGVLRDVSAWYHIVYVIDTTQATAGDRLKIWINGVNFPSASWTSYSAPSLNSTADILFFQSTEIGRDDFSSSGYLNGYLTETYFIDGQALTPSSFGQTNASTGVWEPIPYTGTYGTNGFYLPFSDNTSTTTLGDDFSGNNNDWTLNNFSVTAGAGNDSLVDSPTSYGTDTGVGGEVRSNYCTWNRLQTSSSITLNNGNLDGTISGGFLIYSCAGTIEVTTSKWYYETVVTAGHSTAYPIVGVCDLSQVTSGINTSFYSSTGGGDTTGIIAHATGTTVFLSNNTTTTDGVSYNKTTDVLMIAFDADLGKVWFGKNGTWNNSSNPATNTGGHTFSTVSGKGYRPYVQCNADTSNSWTSNFGQRAFAYTAPSGFKALCTQNLPTPTIGATSTTQADNYFGVALYSGTGAANSNVVSGLEFTTDLWWQKARNAANNNYLQDAVRGFGASKSLTSNSTGSEGFNGTPLTQSLSVSSTGFTVSGSDFNGNTASETYVAWCWNAGGSTVTNTSGTISAQVRANTTSGFSIVTYTGTGANATVGHGIGAVPGMIIAKRRSATQNWGVAHSALTGTQTLYLDLTQAVATGVWNGTPTSTVFNITTDGVVNASGSTYVAYCFAPVAGYSAFGSYTGNGSTDGPFVYLGFRPEFVMIKNATTAGTSWEMFDNARETSNLMDLELLANSSAAEGTYTYGDFVSNGFKLRSTNNGVNQSTATLVYMAFAENPFKYALAR